MKIKIDTQPDGLAQDNVRHMTMTIDGRKFVITRDGCVTALAPRVEANSLGALVASELYSKVDDLRKAEDAIRAVDVLDTWATVPDEVADEIEGCLI